MPLHSLRQNLIWIARKPPYGQVSRRYFSPVIDKYPSVACQSVQIGFFQPDTEFLSSTFAVFERPHAARLNWSSSIRRKDRGSFVTPACLGDCRKTSAQHKRRTHASASAKVREETGSEAEVHGVACFFGRPIGRSVADSPSRAAVCRAHDAGL